MFEKLKHLKDLRSQAKTLQNALAEEQVIASASGVNITMNGNQEVISVSIDPEICNPNKKEDIERGIKEATNDAIKKIQRIMAEKMKSMGGFPGLNM